jgi:hypothetical protein
MIRKAIGSDTFDFISLGPGDGEKDADAILNWIDNGVGLLYYPYDVSVPLSAHAARTVRRRTALSKNRNSLRMKAVIADFRDIETVRSVFLHRDTPNVVSFFGTLGNLGDDRTQLKRLFNVMKQGDLLLLEVRLKGADLDSFRDRDSLRHDFGPMEYYFGMDWNLEAKSVQMSIKSGLSGIPLTDTVVTTYEGEVPGVGPTTVRLQYIHLYDADSLLTKLKGIGFKLVGDPYLGNGFLECVLRR